MPTFDVSALQEKYRQIWHDLDLFTPAMSGAKRPYYNLMMFPYPSAEGLHVGNMYAFTGADVHGRFRRMQGFDVFEPIGLDGFGIHSENYAIKIGKHPAEQAKVSQENFYRQLDMIGNSFAWNNRLETYDPDFYRWTQWLFAEMFRRGLAYRAEASVNWCPSCKTVLADEQVEDGRCERCKSEVTRRQMSSWYLKITDYADRLLDNIDSYPWTDVHGEAHVGLDWPRKVTVAQKNWIGRNPGLDIHFHLESNPKKIVTVWTKFWETIFGATFLVVAPEYAGLADLVAPDQESEVAAYCQAALNKSEQERKAEKHKSGVFTGSFVVNPVNGERVPVYVAEYVLAGVGTGAVMGVPAHDARDFDFAKKYDLPIRQVVEYADAEINQKVARGEQSHEGEGTLVNSGDFNGQSAWGEGKSAMKQWLIDQGFSQERIDYHLRDWLISRQRYWGPPIPMVFCQACEKAGRGERAELPGWYTVPDEQLPVTLPFLEDFTPRGDGTSPLDNASDDWLYTECPHPECHEKAKRETDVSDTFLDSSWYFLRYPTIGRSDASEHPFPQLKENAQAWFPVDAYIGGAEHAVLHLLYARFVTMALKDWGMLSSEEPFPYLFGHGLVVKDGAKMSKSRGNVVNPDEYIQKYGADALRTYLMFMGPYDQGGDFRDTGMHGMYKWLVKVWDRVLSVTENDVTTPKMASELERVIAANTREMGELKYNTCIARLMELMNAWKLPESLSAADAANFVKLLAPFTPYMAEELYQSLLKLENPEAPFRSVHIEPWPTSDSSRVLQASVILAVQVNGKLRGTLTLSPEESNQESLVREQALGLASVQTALSNRDIRKTIFVSGKIVNFVV